VQTISNGLKETWGEKEETRQGESQRFCSVLAQAKQDKRHGNGGLQGQRAMGISGGDSRFAVGQGGIR
jgi:hypothetical protein